MPPARPARTEPANPEGARYRHGDAASRGTAVHGGPGQSTTLQALARQLARRAAAECRAKMEGNADTPIRDAA